MAPPERKQSIRCLGLLQGLQGGAACARVIRGAFAAYHLSPDIFESNSAAWPGRVANTACI